MKKFTVKEKCNLKDFTDCNYPQGSFCYNSLLKNRDIKVNGMRAEGNIPLTAGDEVIYYTTKRQEELKSFEIVFEDENILIADKYSGVTSEGLFAELCGEGEYFAVHRLDRNTEGLIAFAKNREAEKALVSAFKERRISKTYIALCKNAFKEEFGILTAYLSKDSKNSLVKISDKEVKDSSKIITEFKIVEKRGDIALVRIILHTGRTHQIRAHTAHIGCPVLGDEKYGDGALNKKYGVKRQCLIAKTLTFDLTGKFSYLNCKTFESNFKFKI